MVDCEEVCDQLRHGLLLDKPARLIIRLLFGLAVTNSTNIQILRRQCCLGSPYAETQYNSRNCTLYSSYCIDTKVLHSLQYGDIENTAGSHSLWRWQESEILSPNSINYALTYCQGAWHQCQRLPFESFCNDIDAWGNQVLQPPTCMQGRKGTQNNARNSVQNGGLLLKL